MCTNHFSTASYDTASAKWSRPPTLRANSSFCKEIARKKSIGTSICVIHFRGLSIWQGSFNTLISRYLLLGALTCCLNTKTLFMVSVIEDFDTLALRLVHPISPWPLTGQSPLATMNNMRLPWSKSQARRSEFGNKLKDRSPPTPLPIALLPWSPWNFAKRRVAAILRETSEETSY